MKKALAILIVLAACLLALWLLSHRQQPEPVEFALQPDAAEAEESSPEEGIGLLAFLNAMAEKPAPEEAQEPEGTEVQSKPEGGTIAGQVYDLETGTGIEGVGVYVREGRAARLSLWDMPKETPRTTTDHLGSYSVAGLADGTYQVIPDTTKGYPIQAKVLLVTVSSGQVVQGVDFALIRGIRVAGKVVDRQGQAVEGALIRAVGVIPREKADESKADGSFEFYLMGPSNDLLVQARKEPFESEVTGPFVVGHEGLEGLVLKLTIARTASISGIVVDPTGRPLEKVNVYLEKEDENRNVNSNVYLFDRNRAESAANGTFTINNIPPGEYRIPLMGYPDDKMNVELKEGQALTGLRLVMNIKKGELAIAGRVVDTAGKPVAGAEVSCNGPIMQKVSSGADGSFRVTGLVEGEYMFVADHKDYSVRRPLAKAQAGSQDVVVVVMEGKADIEGRVLRADTGQPLTEFQVSYGQGHLARVEPLFSGYVGFTRDPDGRFRSDRVRPGDYSVMAAAPGFAPEFVNLTLTENETKNVELRLQPIKALTGRVLDPAQNPVPGAFVYLGRIPDRYSWASWYVARTDSDGTFVIDSYPPDCKWLAAYHPKYAPAAAPLSENAVIVLQNASKLEGVVTRGGSPAEARVDIDYLSDVLSYGYDSTRAGRDGTFSFENLMPDTVKVRAVFGNAQSPEQQVALEPGKTARVELAIQSGTATLEGRITINGEPPAQHAWASLRIVTSGGEESRYASAKSDGSYLMEGLPAGQATLRVQAYGSDFMRPRGKRLDVTIVEGQSLHQDIDFTGNGKVYGLVSGIKIGYRGYVQLIPGEVEIGEAPDPRDVSQLSVSFGSCDPEGSYLIRDIEPGMYTVVAVSQPQSGGITDHSFASRVVTIQGDETVKVDFDFR